MINRPRPHSSNNMTLQSSIFTCPRACAPNLVKCYPLGFEVHVFGICGAPYGSDGKCFGTPIPNHTLNMCTKIFDDWTNHQWTMANFLLLLIVGGFSLIAAMFFDQSFSFLIQMCISKIHHGGPVWSRWLFCRAHWAGHVCQILSQSETRPEGHGLSKTTWELPALTLINS